MFDIKTVLMSNGAVFCMSRVHLRSHMLIYCLHYPIKLSYVVDLADMLPCCVVKSSASLNATPVLVHYSDL